MSNEPKQGPGQEDKGNVGRGMERDVPPTKHGMPGGSSDRDDGYQKKSNIKKLPQEIAPDDDEKLEDEE